ncbi:hypothetical protein Nepgr_000261 [Nepenthes gracilis]|uniref:Uncharacterized protein n=1 Tax=Nepenthes gracilis TaxID=150966 RepID=A0AAD3P3K5_NEPGR|nr:hypothetical protein Nepgr_000261 [Nepenthes gracilis]
MNRGSINTFILNEKPIESIDHPSHSHVPHSLLDCKSDYRTFQKTADSCSGMLSMKLLIHCTVRLADMNPVILWGTSAFNL